MTAPTRTDTKSVTILVAGSKNTYDLELEPGSTSRDIFETLNSDHGLDLDPTVFRLRSDRIGSFFGPNENVYAKVEPGEKLHAVKSIDVAH